MNLLFTSNHSSQGRKWPTTIISRPLGPKAQQPIGGRRSGLRSLPAWAVFRPVNTRPWRAVHLRKSKIGRLSGHLAGTKPPSDLFPCNPSPFPFCSPRISRSTQAAAAGATVPACPPTTAKSSAAAGPLLSCCFSFLCFLCFPSPSLALA
jgi:hypothetical protein